MIKKQQIVRRGGSIVGAIIDIEVDNDQYTFRFGDIDLGIPIEGSTLAQKKAFVKSYIQDAMIQRQNTLVSFTPVEDDIKEETFITL